MRAVFAVTGGGVSALSRLLAEAGASATVLDARIPYSAAALEIFLGGRVEGSASERTARAMAMAAFMEARQFDDSFEVAGIACTAAIATNRTRRGSDRAHLAIQTADRTAVTTVEFERASRAEQEAQCRDLVLQVTAAAAGLEGADALDWTLARPEWRELLRGERAHTSNASPGLVLSGSFNPIHAGHLQMASVAQRLTGVQPTLEISAFNVDKPPIDYLEFATRDAQPRGGLELTFTNAPTFIEKARVFRGATFIVGVDTITRIGAPRYYGGATGLTTALEELAALGTRFLVFGRQDQKRFLTLDDVDLPASLRDMCTGVSEQDFRVDVSSTELRAQQAYTNGQTP